MPITVIDTPLRYIVTMDADGVTPSFFQKEIQRRVDDGGGGDVVPAVVITLDITAADKALIEPVLNAAPAALTARLDKVAADAAADAKAAAASVQEAPAGQ